MTHQFFETWLTVGHIPKKISRHCYFFREGGGNITEHLISTTSEISPIPAGGLEVPLLLRISVKSERIFKLIKIFCQFISPRLYCRRGRKCRRQGSRRWKNRYKVNRRGERNKWKQLKCYWNRLIVYVSIFILLFVKSDCLVNLVFRMRFNLNKVFSSDAWAEINLN